MLACLPGCLLATSTTTPTTTPTTTSTATWGPHAHDSPGVRNLRKARSTAYFTCMLCMFSSELEELSVCIHGCNKLLVEACKLQSSREEDLLRFMHLLAASRLKLNGAICMSKIVCTRRGMPAKIWSNSSWFCTLSACSTI